MGKYNSSLTRVKPLGEYILKNHSSIDALLKTVNCGLIKFGNFSNENVFFSGDKRKEKALNPTKTHLKGILDLIINDCSFRNNIRKKALNNSKSVDELTKKTWRSMLFDLDKRAISTAYSIVNNESLSKNIKWAYFEGKTYPDLFIENEDYILLIEGKRTENNTTKANTYLKNRSQMIRHIQNAHNYAINKKIIAFYIVDEKCNYTNSCTKDFFKDEIDKETIKLSNEDKNIILNSFYGYTTWKEVEDALKIKFEE